MPRTIDEGFRDFVAKLTPTTTESSGASSHRASIETCLKNNFGLLRFTRIGSFGNGTSISGYSDVDYLASFPRDQLTDNSNYSLLKIKTVLENRFPNTGVRVNCPAIVIPFGLRKSETTEIVPMDLIKESNGYKIYDLADGSGGWMQASPDAHNDYVHSINIKLNSKVKPLIRFLKAWKFIRDVPISSFYLELQVAKYSTGETSIQYDIDVKNILKLLWNSQLASMQDPMGVSGYISACSTDIKKKDALSKLERALIRAEKAREATVKENIKDAFDWWRLLYDNKFPTYYYE